jgi:hypothetical protein
VALAEDDASVQTLGWTPHRVERGFAASDTTVTVQGIIGTGGPMYSSGSTPEEHLEAITQIVASTCGGWAGIGLFFESWHPLLVLNPSIASLFESHGWTKYAIRDLLHREAKVPARWMTRTFRDVGMTNLDRADGMDHVQLRLADLESDPEKLVPALIHPEWTNIVVAGDPARNQSRFYVNNHRDGIPVTRRVDFVD